MLNHNFYCLFESRQQSDPTGAFLELETGERISTQLLHELCGRYANAFRRLRCSAGDRIAVQLEKSTHALALYLACLRAGLCYVPINTAYRAFELAYLLKDAQPSLLLRGLSAEAFPDSALPRLTKVLTCGTRGEGTFASIAEAEETSFPTVQLSPEASAALLYTSGTTGRPKGALISHGALSYTARTLSKLWGFSSADVLLHALPIFHSHGLFISFNVAIAGNARILLQSKFDTIGVLGAIPHSTVFMGVPTFYHRLLAEASFDRASCKNMRLFISGSAPLSAPVHRDFEARTGHRILERYGSTEAMILCSNPLEGDRRPGSVGQPIPGVDLRITGEEDEPLSAGEVGMIQARGPGLFTNYWNNIDQTKSEFTTDGFFRTGDMGFMDGNGYVSITGRAKDLIISGGYNIYPAEVEGIIDEMPSVRESAVVGTAHPDFGECVVAFVIPADKTVPPTERDVIQHVKQHLASYKAPKQVVVVDELPRNALGKVLKKELRGSR